MQKDRNGQKQIKTNNPAVVKAGSKYFAKYIFVTAICSLIFFYMGDVYRSKNMQIKYISQGELLTLEKERVSALNIKDQQLFFGKPEQVIKHIEQMQKDMSQSGVILVLADGKIYGSNVSSISKEVHQLIIDRLGGKRK
jgi:cell division septal protein FtsQ